MASGTRRRTRSERVAALELPPGFLERTWDYLQRGDVLVRLGLCALCALVLWLITGGWAPPLSYRTGYTPLRNIVARVHFEKPEPQRTLEARERAQREVRSVYEQDKEPLVQLRAGLMNQVSRILKVQSLAELEDGVWQEFFASSTPDKAALAAGRARRAFRGVSRGPVDSRGAQAAREGGGRRDAALGAARPAQGIAARTKRRQPERDRRLSQGPARRPPHFQRQRRDPGRRAAG